MRYLASHYSQTSRQGFQPFSIFLHHETLNEHSWTFATPLLPSKPIAQTLLSFVVAPVASLIALFFRLQELNWLSLTSSTLVSSCTSQTMIDSQMANPC